MGDMEGNREIQWPVRFAGYWGDDDQDDPHLPEPWETFTVWVNGAEAGDVRELIPADLPALLDALGAVRIADADLDSLAVALRDFNYEWGVLPTGFVKKPPRLVSDRERNAAHAVLENVFGIAKGTAGE